MHQSADAGASTRAKRPRSSSTSIVVVSTVLAVARMARRFCASAAPGEEFDALLFCPLGRGDLDDRGARANEDGRRGAHRVVVDSEVTRSPSADIEKHVPTENGSPRRHHPSQIGAHLGRQGHDLADRATDVVIDRYPADLRHRSVDPHVPQLEIEHRDSHGSRSHDRFDEAQRLLGGCPSDVLGAQEHRPFLLGQPIVHTVSGDPGDERAVITGAGWDRPE